MTIQTATRELQINGGNRGGRAYTDLLLKRPYPLKPKDIIGKTDIFDPIADRAIDLAYLYRLCGIPANGHGGRAEESAEIPAALRGLFIDDLEAMENVIYRQPNEEELQFNFLLASGFPSYGGQIVGLLGHIDRRDEDSRHYGQLLVSMANQLVGSQRTTSRAMMLPIQSLQMDSTRLVAHQKLADEAREYFSGKATDSGLYAAETLTPTPPNIYPVKVVEVKDKPREEVCLERALSIARDQGKDALAVAFVHQSEPWLHLEYLVDSPTWRRRNKLTIPVSPSIREAHRTATTPRVVATD